MAALASVPLPYTSAGLAGSGGCNRIVRSDTLAGSASTAASSLTVSGTRKSCPSWALNRSAWAPGEEDCGGTRAPSRVPPPYPAHTEIVSYRRDGGPPIVPRLIRGVIIILFGR